MGSAAAAAACSMLGYQGAASSPSPLPKRSTLTAEPAADSGPSGPGLLSDGMGEPCSGPDDLQLVPSRLVLLCLNGLQECARLLLQMLLPLVTKRGKELQHVPYPPVLLLLWLLLHLRAIQLRKRTGWPSD